MKFKFLLIAIILTQFSCTRIDNEVLRKTIEWNNAHNTRETSQLFEMYAPNLVGYCKETTLDDFKTLKGFYLNKYKDFSQSITSDLIIKTYTEKRVKAEFTKRVSYSGKVKSYRAYLVFQKINGEYKIIEESDETTNSNFGYTPNLPEPQKVKVISNSDIRAGTDWTTISLASIAGLALFAGFGFYRKSRHSKNLQEQIKNEPQIVQSTVIIQNVKNTETAKSKGDDFEDYVFRSFRKEYFKCKYWTGDKGLDGHYADANKDPDMIFNFELPDSSQEFAVECKWREKSDDRGFIEICRSDQLNNYKVFAKNRKMDVFIVLGIGGTADCPENVYPMPLREILHHKVKLSWIENNYQSKPHGTTFYYDMDLGVLK